MYFLLYTFHIFVQVYFLFYFIYDLHCSFRVYIIFVLILTPLEILRNVKKCLLSRTFCQTFNFFRDIILIFIILLFLFTNRGLPWWLSGKESVCRYSRHRFDVWVGKIPGRQKWQPTLVFLPGKSCGQRSLGVYSPPVCKRVGHNLASKQQQSLWKSTKSIYQLLILSEISVPVFFRHYL